MTAEVLGQQQGAGVQRERSFAERLLQPDRTQRSQFEGKMYRPGQGEEMKVWGGGREWADSGRAYRQVRIIEPKKFLGVPLPWKGSEKRVNTGPSALADKTFVTRMARLVEGKPQRHPEAWAHGLRTRVASEQMWARGERQVVPRGESQSLLDAHRGKLSPEELRELLNKHVPLLQSTQAAGGDGPRDGSR